jgi:glutaredoxin
MLALSALLASAPALAQFKVVEPGGRVTYTDRPPAYQSVPDARAVSPAGAPQAGTAEGLAAGLPYTLRQVVLRFPVRLVVGSGCPPCESARRLLRSRGVPVQELSVDRPEDVERLQRDFGSRELPVLLVGRERQVGYAEAAWLATLDAAGYPATPMLPTGYRAPAPQPLAGPRAVAEAPDAERAEPPAPVVSPLSGGGIRF